MAAGDALAVRLGPAAAAGRINFQPAAGTEFAITHIASRAGGTSGLTVDIFDGTNAVQLQSESSQTILNGLCTLVGTTTYITPFNKIFITNSIYLSLNALQAGDVAFITGVQTK